MPDLVLHLRLLRQSLSAALFEDLEPYVRKGERTFVGTPKSASALQVSALDSASRPPF